MLSVGTAISALALRGRSGRAALRLVSGGVPGPQVATGRAGLAWRVTAAGDLTATPADQPRLDHDPSSGAPLGYLIESASENLNPEARATTAGWSGFGGTHTDLALNAMGQFPGVSVASAGGYSDRLNSPVIALTGGHSYALRLIYQAGSSATMRLILRAGSGAYSMVNGPLGAMQAAGSGAGPLGLLRDAAQGPVRVLDAVFTPGLTDGFQIGIGPHSATVGDSVTVLGLQVEPGTVPTSFVVTDGAPAARAADLPATQGVTGLWRPGLTYGDGSTELLPPTLVSDGWWPPMARPVLRDLVLHPA